MGGGQSKTQASPAGGAQQSSSAAPAPPPAAPPAPPPDADEKSPQPPARSPSSSASPASHRDVAPAPEEPAPQELQPLLRTVASLTERRADPESAAHQLRSAAAQLRRLAPRRCAAAAAPVLCCTSQYLAADCVPEPALAAADLLHAVLRHGTASYDLLREQVVQGWLLPRACELLRTEADSGARLRLRISEVLTVVCRQCPPARPAVREALFEALRECTDGSPPCFKGVAPVLQALQPMLEGLREPLGKKHERTLLRVLSPLFREDAMIDDATCALSLYARPLCKSTRTLLRKVSYDSHQRVGTACFETLLGAWTRENSRHGAQMVSCFEELLEEIDGDVWDSIYRELLRRVGECLMSDNAALATRALALFTQDAFLHLLGRHQKSAVSGLVPALVRDGRPHWDAGVNSLTLQAVHVLRATADVTPASPASPSTEMFDEVAKRHLQKVLRLGSAEEAGQRLESYLAALDVGQGARQKERLETERLQREREKEPQRMPLPSSVDHHLHFVFGRELGAGSYSTVKYARRIEVHVPQKLWREYACKVISKQHIQYTDAQGQIQQEIELLERFDHPLISPLYATFQDEKNFYVVLEYCARGDIFGAIFEHGAGSASEEWCRFALAEIALAIAYVQGEGFLYGDLKPENVLLTASGHLRLCDFGSCKSVAQLKAINEAWLDGDRDLRRDFQGTAEYLAPEVVEGSPVDFSADWWSLGVTAYQLLCAHLPFSAETEEQLFALIRAAAPLMPPSLSLAAVQLIGALLRKGPDSRPQGDELRKEPFFAEIDFDTVSSSKAPQLSSGPLRSRQSLADPRFQRKYSMFWTPDAGLSPHSCGAPAGLAVEPVPEETEINASWDSEPPPPPEWLDATAPVCQPQKPEKETVARIGGQLEDYVSTVPWAQTGSGGARRRASRRGGRGRGAPDRTSPGGPRAEDLEDWEPQA